MVGLEVIKCTFPFFGQPISLSTELAFNPHHACTYNVTNGIALFVTLMYRWGTNEGTVRQIWTSLELHLLSLFFTLRCWANLIQRFFCPLEELARVFE